MTCGLWGGAEAFHAGGGHFRVFWTVRLACHTRGASCSFKSCHPSLVSRAVVTKEGQPGHRMLTCSLHLRSQGAGPTPWTHPRLGVYSLPAAVCVRNACPTRDIKNNPVANSISQNNCLQSALLGRLATKIKLPSTRACVWLLNPFPPG